MKLVLTEEKSDQKREGISIMQFETLEGYIIYHFVTKDIRYEFDEEDSPFWNKTHTWIMIENIQVTIKYQKNGRKLLNQFIESLLPDTGIVLNASPLDSDLSFEQLQKWYISQGFKQIDERNLSLYLIR